MFPVRCYFSLLAFPLRTHKPMYKSPILSSLPFWECVTQSLPLSRVSTERTLHLLSTPSHFSVAPHSTAVWLLAQPFSGVSSPLELPFHARPLHVQTHFHLVCDLCTWLCHGRPLGVLRWLNNLNRLFLLYACLFLRCWSHSRCSVNLLLLQ